MEVSASLGYVGDVWPHERAHGGVCDFCLLTDALVVSWGGENPGEACESCWTAMAEAWAELSSEEQAEALNG